MDLPEFNGEVPEKGWTEEMDDYLREWYPTSSTTTIAYRLGRSKSATIDRAGRLGIKKAIKTGWKRRNAEGNF